MRRICHLKFLNAEPDEKPCMRGICLPPAAFPIMHPFFLQCGNGSPLPHAPRRRQDTSTDKRYIRRLQARDHPQNCTQGRILTGQPQTCGMPPSSIGWACLPAISILPLDRHGGVANKIMAGHGSSFPWITCHGGKMCMGDKLWRPTCDIGFATSGTMVAVAGHGSQTVLQRGSLVVWRM